MQKRNQCSVLICTESQKNMFCCGSLKKRKWKENCLPACIPFYFWNNFLENTKQYLRISVGRQGLLEAYFFTRSNYFDTDSFQYHSDSNFRTYIKAKSDFMPSQDLFVNQHIIKGELLFGNDVKINSLYVINNKIAVSLLTTLQIKIYIHLSFFMHTLSSLHFLVSFVYLQHVPPHVPTKPKFTHLYTLDHLKNVDTMLNLILILPGFSK